MNDSMRSRSRTNKHDIPLNMRLREMNTTLEHNYQNYTRRNSTKHSSHRTNQDEIYYRARNHRYWVIIWFKIIIIQIASVLVKEQTTFWTYTLIYLAMGCFSIFAFTVISRSTLMYPSKCRCFYVYLNDVLYS